MSDEKLDLNVPENTSLKHWPQNGEVYDCIIAVPFVGSGVLVDGPQEIQTWCEETGAGYLLDDFLKNAPERMGVYHVRLKYWASGGEESFEDGFTVEVVKRFDLALE